MNGLNLTLVLLAAFLAVFFESTVDLTRNFLGAQIDLLSPLMVYTGLSHGLIPIVLLAALGGLWFDSLSVNPLGVSVLPLLLIGVINFQTRALLLRENTYAQFIIGLCASASTQVLTILIIHGLGDSPLIGWQSIWQLIVVALAGGLATPILFRVFDRVSGALNYQPTNQTSFRADREIKRGR